MALSKCPKCGEDTIVQGSKQGEYICLDCHSIIRAKKKQGSSSSSTPKTNSNTNNRSKISASSKMDADVKPTSKTTTPRTTKNKSKYASVKEDDRCNDSFGDDDYKNKSNDEYSNNFDDELNDIFGEEGNNSDDIDVDPFDSMPQPQQSFVPQTKKQSRRNNHKQQKPPFPDKASIEDGYDDYNEKEEFISAKNNQTQQQTKLPREVSVAAFVLSIIALLVSWIQFGSFLGVVFSIFGVIFSYLSLAKIKRGEAGGKGITITAMIIGIIALVISIIVSGLTAMHWMSIYDEYKTLKNAAGGGIAALTQKLNEQSIPKSSSGVDAETKTQSTDKITTRDLVDGAIDLAINNTTGGVGGAIIDKALEDPQVQSYIADAKNDAGQVKDELQNMYEQSGVAPEKSAEENVNGLGKLLDSVLGWLPFSSNGKTLLG